MINWQGNSRIKASRIVTKSSGSKPSGTKPSGNPDFSVILDTICSCTTEEEALIIAECLYESFMARNARVSGLRACVVYALAGNDSWTIVQWGEAFETDVLAVFGVPEVRASPGCNYIMHSGLRNCHSQVQPGSKYWMQSTLSWKVTSIVHLQELFKGTQHILGMLGWSRTDLLRVYCKDGTQNHLAEGTDVLENLTRDANLLVPHLIRIRLAKVYSEKVSPQLENLSTRELVSGSDGSCQTLLRASVEL